MNTDKIKMALKNATKDVCLNPSETAAPNWYETYEEADRTLREVDKAYPFNEFVREHGDPDDELFEMEFLEELTQGGGDWSDPIFVLQRAFYGYDYNPFDTKGEHREAFNPNREYFTFNGYGNLVSVREEDAMRYWASILDEDAYIDAAADEGKLEEIAAALGIDAEDEDETED